MTTWSWTLIWNQKCSNMFQGKTGYLISLCFSTQTCPSWGKHGWRTNQSRSISVLCKQFQDILAYSLHSFIFHLLQMACVRLLQGSNNIRFPKTSLTDGQVTARALDLTKRTIHASLWANVNSDPYLLFAQSHLSRNWTGRMSSGDYWVEVRVAWNGNLFELSTDSEILSFSPCYLHSLLASPSPLSACHVNISYDYKKDSVGNIKNC